jgi:transposase
MREEAMARSDMSDLERDFIKAVLPNKSRGVKRVDDRRVINGIFHVLRTGIPWADLPGEYGPPTTIYNRFNRWSHVGHCDRITGQSLLDFSSLTYEHSANNITPFVPLSSPECQIRDRDRPGGSKSDSPGPDHGGCCGCAQRG